MIKQLITSTSLKQGLDSLYSETLIDVFEAVFDVFRQNISQNPIYSECDLKAVRELEKQLHDNGKQEFIHKEMRDKPVQQGPINEKDEGTTQRQINEPNPGWRKKQLQVEKSKGLAKQDALVLTPQDDIIKKNKKYLLKDGSANSVLSSMWKDKTTSNRALIYTSKREENLYSSNDSNSMFSDLRIQIPQNPKEGSSSLHQINDKGKGNFVRTKLPPVRKAKTKRDQPMHGADNLLKILTRPLIPQNHQQFLGFGLFDPPLNNEIKSSDLNKQLQDIEAKLTEKRNLKVIKNPALLNYQKKVTNWIKIHKYNVLIQKRNKNYAGDLNQTRESIEAYSRNPSKHSLLEDIDTSIHKRNLTVSPLIIKKLIKFTKFENNRPFINPSNINQILEEFTFNKKQE